MHYKSKVSLFSGDKILWMLKTERLALLIKTRLYVEIELVVTIAAEWCCEVLMKIQFLQSPNFAFERYILSKVLSFL